MTLVAVLAVVAPAVAWWSRRSRRAGVPDPRRELASVAMHLSRSTRAGLTPLEALQHAGSVVGGVVGDEVAATCDRMRRGASFDGALAEWADRCARGPARSGAPRPEDVELLSVATRFALQQGSGLPEVFDGATAALVDRAEVADEVRALTSQARASIAVLCALPVVGVVMVGSLMPAAADALFGTPLGWASLAVATLADAAAVAVCSVLTARVMR
jgi:tight adherence protein B